MNNPSAPYPGRQLFLGLTAAQEPCLAYLVTGRSPESRRRKAIPVDNTIRIGPLGNVPYDANRHYRALKYDQASGLVAVTNGIQTEAIYETYKLLFDLSSPTTKDYMEKILDGANAEPDSLYTPRIAGVIIPTKDNPVFIIGIKTYDSPAAAYQVAPVASQMTGVSTYKGDFDNPEPTDPTARLSRLEFKGRTSRDLAQYLYDMSAATYKDEDIRVCSVSGIYSNNTWDIAIINRY